MKTECTNCHQHYEVEDEYLGQEAECQQCGTTFIIKSCVRAQKVHHVERPNTRQKKYCNKCGRELNVDAKFCSNCGHQQGTEISEVDDKSWKDSFSRVAGVEKLEGFSFSALFSDVFSRHSQEEVEDYFTVGTSKTTPPLSEVDTSWPRPWVFFRMLITSIIVFLLFWFSFSILKYDVFLPGLIITGSFAIPFSTLIFFMEVNIVRNVSLYQVNKSVFLGGVLSLMVSLFLLRWTGGMEAWLGDSVAGIVEETGKFLTVLLLAVNNKRYNYMLNGLLLGAAVGTGFEAFETAAYALKYGIRNLVMRGLQAPFAHIVWTAITAAALWRVKGTSKFSLNMLVNPKFLRLFAVPVVLHMIWNSPLQHLFYGNTWIILGIVAWIIVFSLVQEGLREVKEAKIREMEDESC